MAVSRVTGLTSGIDTDAMVKSMLQIEQARVDRANADKQISTWKQEQYREIFTELDDFKDKYFDLLNNSTNLRSESMFAKFNVSVKAGSTDSSAVSVVGTSESSDLNHTISSITQLATKDKYTSGDLDFKKITTGTVDVSTMPNTFKMKLAIDGVVKEISIDKADVSPADLTEFNNVLQDRIESAFGADYRDVVSVEGGALAFEKAGTSITILEDPSSTESMTFLGVTSGTSTSSYKEKNIGELLGITSADLNNMTVGTQNLSELGITEDMTMEAFVEAFNENSAGAVLSYDTLKDKFVMESSKEGSANALTLSAEMESKLKLDVGTHDAAQNAKLVIDGESVTKSSNRFLLDGTQYTLNETYTETEPLEIELTRDTEAVADVLKDFVEDYNKIVAKLTVKVNEPTYRDFQPLTAEQKKDMTEADIELWEEKAKSGLLKNDPLVSNILSEMRGILYSSVEGADISLYEMGITTSPDYRDNGTLVINEDKLNEALETNFDDVVKLFTSSSDKKYLDTDNSEERYNESGIADRLLDVMNNYIRTTRDDDGNKGHFVEKAGTPGDKSTTNSMLAKEIAEADKRVEILLEYLESKEESYYLQFARMESALSEMQSQSSALMSQLGG